MKKMNCGEFSPQLGQGQGSGEGEAVLRVAAPHNKPPESDNSKDVATPVAVRSFAKNASESQASTQRRGSSDKMAHCKYDSESFMKTLKAGEVDVKAYATAPAATSTPSSKPSPTPSASAPRWAANRRLRSKPISARPATASQTRNRLVTELAVSEQRGQLTTPSP
ncbi:MAG: hypothetical protein ABSE69_16195 [Roseiarcus sp.]|jgi:hypothetical protein